MANRGGILDAISVEQLIRSPGKLIEGAENGQLAVVTKAGRPLFLAVPYDERLAGRMYTSLWRCVCTSATR